MTTTPHGQLSEADVKRLYAEKKFGEINQARKEGRLAAVLGVPAEDVALLDRARHGRVDSDDVTRLWRLRRDDLIEQARVEGRIIDHPTTR